MFTKKLSIDKYTIILHLTEAPRQILGTSLLFGNPLTKESIPLDSENSYVGNSLKGHWLKMDIEDEKLVLTNDILGGFRTYYHQKENRIVISDDYSFIIKKANIPLIKNNVEYQYWLKHRYTTGKSTFIKGLHKINPASIFTITKNGINETTYFKDLKLRKNKAKHQDIIHQDLVDTFKHIGESPKTKILFFSGGKDSCLLLKYLLKLKIPFTPVFLKSSPLNKHVVSDLLKVRAVAKQLNIEIDEIEVSLSEISSNEKQEIVKKQLFDRHYSFLHYQGLKKVGEKYGENCLLINGQSSDNILSFGPSEKGLMSYFRRSILYKSNSLISLIGLYLLKIKTRKNFKLPKTEQEKLMTLFDDYKYTRVFELSKSKDYYNYIDNYINEQLNRFKNYSSKQMYMKVASYLQGSDNQVVINSSNAYSMDVIMPFATPEILYSTVMYKDEELEIKKPKYVVEGILKEEFSFYYENLKFDKQTINFNPSKMQFSIEDSYKIFYDEIEKMFVD